MRQSPCSTRVTSAPPSPTACSSPGSRPRQSLTFFEKLAQRTVDGIRLGLIIAITSVGLSLIFGTTGLTNFAHGELVTFGAMMVVPVQRDHRPPAHRRHRDRGRPRRPLRVTCSTPGSSRRSRREGHGPRVADGRHRRPRASCCATSTCSSSAATSGSSAPTTARWRGTSVRSRSRRATSPSPSLSLAVLVAVALVLQRTRLGKATRAVSDNGDLASATGIDTARIIRLVWISGAALAALGGVFRGLDEGINPDMGVEPAVPDVRRRHARRPRVGLRRPRRRVHHRGLRRDQHPVRRARPS